MWDDVLLGSVPGGATGPEIRVTKDSSNFSRSLWFDARSGISYTIGGTGHLELGLGILNQASVITVVSDLNTVTENNIENSIVFSEDIPFGNLWIRNDSLGGLRLGSSMVIGSQNLWVSNTGRPLARSAVHFNGAIFGTGNIYTVNGSTQHLVLQADNANNWKGMLNVGVGTLVFVKQDGALGDGANIVNSGMDSGGTLGFRSHVGSTLNYTHANVQTLQVAGRGAVRTWGREGVGAIYHDGGSNTFAGDISMWGHASFGARGGAGGLTLSGKISGGGFQFTKVGPGLITLTNPTNQWTGNTFIQDGVLRITTRNALPLNSRLVFGVGGVLELGGDLGHLNLNIGTQLAPIGQGSSLGFSAKGGDRTVSINGPGYIFQESESYHWNLSSRYADSKITLVNGSPTRARTSSGAYTGSPTMVNVPRGVSIQASAVISGAPPSIYKTGLGLLEAYGAPQVPHLMLHIINGGALAVGDLNYSVGFQGAVWFEGGVLGLTSDLLKPRSFFLWMNNSIVPTGGGFAAYGAADRVVRLGNSTAPINWIVGPPVNGNQHFVTDGGMLMFGHYTSNGTILWDMQLGLGTNQNRTINVERGLPAAAVNRADVSFTQGILGIGGSLTIQGDGRMDIAVDNPGLQVPTINVNGAELRLQRAGRIAAQATHFSLKNGGTLTLDNFRTHRAGLNGFYSGDRIHDNSTITLNASTLTYMGGLNQQHSEEKVGTVILADGANTIDVAQPSSFGGATLRATSLFRASTTPATLNITANRTSAQFALDSWADSQAINDTAGGTKITPWATFNGVSWATPVSSGSSTTLAGLISYENSLVWQNSSNAHLTAGVIALNGETVTNSLKMSDGGGISLNSHNLFIRSGGLLVTGSSSVFLGNGSISTVFNRPLYAHVYAASGLSLSGGAQFAVPSLVKTGPGTLWLRSGVTHGLGSGLYIHQGTVDLQQGSIATSRIVIGDGAGKDTLKLAPNRWNQLTGKPHVTLRGTPYGPGAEYASYNPDEAIFQLGGNTKQAISTLRIEGRGTIDWFGGEVGKANMLFVDRLEFDTAEARLFMRNWYEYEDYFLVRKVGFDFGNLGKIIFDGYWDLSALAVSYDADYYMLTPFNAPEPETYGAILGALGLGLWSWRRRRARRVISAVSSSPPG